MRTHGYKGTDVYRLWGQIVTRCENPNAKSYRWYGARGITMDDTWRSDPKSFCDWVIAHGYKAGLEIDRIDVDGNYTPNNCQFVTHKENCAPNKRRLRATNKTGERNICFSKHGKFEAYAYINGKQKYIGAYRTLADAVKARDIAEGSIHDGEGGQHEEG